MIPANFSPRRESLSEKPKVQIKVNYSALRANIAGRICHCASAGAVWRCSFSVAWLPHSSKA